MDWIDLAPDRAVVSAVMNLRVPYSAGSSVTS